MTTVDFREMAQRAGARFDALSRRERALVLVSVLAVIWLAWDWSMGQSQRRALDAARRTHTALTTQVEAEVRTQEMLRARSASDPNHALSSERSQLEGEIASLDARLEATVGRFVPPNQIPSLLKAILQRYPGVSLVRVRSQPAEPVRIAEEKKPTLYRHPLQVELQGSYFDIKSYLADLESTDWQLAWRSLEYRVTEYPRATVVFEIETLSPDQNWLGV
jgi:MSHA biogenesis protein MshJ